MEIKRIPRERDTEPNSNCIRQKMASASNLALKRKKRSDVAFDPIDVAPGKMGVQGLGADLYNLMQLGTIPDSDILPVAAMLK